MLSPQAIDSFRVLLDENGYAAVFQDGSADEELRLRRTEPGSPLRTLFTLFLTGHNVHGAEAERVFSPALLAALIDQDILSRDGDSITSNYRIAASEGIVLMHDPYPPTRLEHVTGLNAAAHSLASLTVRKPVESALDLCAGSGYQSLLLARHCQRVVATDILPRALWLLELNAGLNGVTNIEWRLGNFFDPIGADEKFDVVVCNPPFIISPEHQFAFRDGGLAGDAVSELVMQGLTRHMNEGAFGTMLLNWGLREGESWEEPGRRWLEGRGCDAVFLRGAILDQLDYAAMWNSHLPYTNPEAYPAAIDTWSGYLEEVGFKNVAEMGVVMQRRAGTNWLLPLQADANFTGNATAQIERLFEAQNFLVQNEAQLLDQRFDLVEPHRLEQVMTYRDGSYEILKASMFLEQNMGLVGEIPPNLIAILFRLAGGTLREVITGFASDLDIEPQEIMDDAVAMVHQLFERGLIARL